MKPTLVSMKSHDDGRLIVHVFRRTEGTRDLFSIDLMSMNRSPMFGPTFGSRAEAEEEADREVRRSAHCCSAACSEWVRVC